MYENHDMLLNQTNLPISWEGRAILLLDLDAFFASVEQLDHPSWRGKPVIVGGSAEKRGVVSTCSYEARAFGVHSAMPASQAAKLCPHAIWTHGNFGRYKEVSAQVMAIMYAESPYLQQVSIDEAFLDVSPTRFGKQDPVTIAKRIQDHVRELGITCSIGLGVSKAVAKIASDLDKPDGLTIVYPGREKGFLAPLPIKVMSGIGLVAQRKLQDMGITTLGELASAEGALLERIFGSNAENMRMRCLGADTDPVEEPSLAKSISNEMSFAQDLTQRVDIEAAISTVASKVARRLRMKKLYCKGVTLKLRYANRSIRTASESFETATDNEYQLIPRLNSLLDSLWSEGIPIRLIGAAAYNLLSDPEEQLQLFPADTLYSKNEEYTMRNIDNLTQATDAVRNRFGESALQYGREMRTLENLTGSSSKNPADYR